MEVEESILNPVGWWLDGAHNPTNPFPVLTKIALGLFTVPAMSSECERVFSEAKRLITDDHNSQCRDYPGGTVPGKVTR